ncbi:DUF4199 domain-containing protein [Confluentibacter flavum]|uniref:DUF4199 domain-containing protein n=1 Tax=Confluentibacter flavum TaxID=1909700 RepID=A0A2N3HNB0_9FLAO|nr:DUF4199 domain-containing protein [Confluentibacter flavum]PKQ46364.1 DUF4199 domain-containing protein [Confluentibacter flavum]
MKNSTKTLAIHYGLYLGSLLSIFTALGYAFNLGLLVNFWIMLLIIPIGIICFGIFSTAKVKKKLNGFLDFKQAFSSYFITVAIGIMISTFVTILIFNFIDKDAALEAKNILIENTENMLINAGAPNQAISENINKIESQDTFALGIQLKSLAQSLIFFAVIGLIVAAVMKKTDPNAS